MPRKRTVKCPHCGHRIVLVAHAAMRDWSRVDWSRSTTEIARTLAVTKGNVSTYRALLAPQTLGVQRAPRPVARRYAGVDWSQTNRKIAATLGVPYQSVLYARKVLMARASANRPR